MKPGRMVLPVEVEHLRARSDVLFQLFRRADLSDPAELDRHGLAEGFRGVECDDVRVC